MLFQENVNFKRTETISIFMTIFLIPGKVIHKYLLKGRKKERKNKGTNEETKENTQQVCPIKQINIPYHLYSPSI